MSTEHRTQFDYLLNAFEEASQSAAPAAHGYAEKRRALFAYVRGLEADRARLDWLLSEAEYADVQVGTGLSLVLPYGPGSVKDRIDAALRTPTAPRSAQEVARG